MKKSNTNSNVNFSTIQYHLVFCPRYRRKIFLIDGVEGRFIELLTQICRQKKYDVVSMKCGPDYCHLLVNVSPSVSAHDVMKDIKAATATPLIEEFQELSQMRTVWTRNFLASTAEKMPIETIKNFVEAQKKR